MNIRSRSIRCFLLGTALAVLTATRAAALPKQFHVSLQGMDGNPGTAQRPFRTLERARDAVRAAGPTRGATVWIHGGRYAIVQPFLLSAKDSGSAGAPVTYRAVPGEDVWLCGGQTVSLSAFSPVTDRAILERLPTSVRGKVVCLALARAGIADVPAPWPDHWWVMRRTKPSLFEVFADGRRLPLARWPNAGYAQFGKIVEPALEPDKLPAFTYSGERPAHWRTASGVWLYGFWRRAYRAEFLRIKAIDTEHRTIQLAGRHSLGGLDTAGARRFFAINLLEELDAPGEWFLDRNQGVLYLLPPAAMKKREVTLSLVVPAVVQCTGAAFVEFRGVGIECSRQDGIRIEGGRSCRVVGCGIRNVGRYGVFMEGDGHALIGCDVHDTGAMGVVFRGGDRRTLTGGHGVIDNNHIHHCNRIARAGLPAVRIDGIGHRFSHNLVHDTGYIAVGFQGNDHVIEYNRLFRTNTEAVEGGVFYTGRDWTSRGTVIRYNFIHHVEDSMEGCGSATRFVHLDDSAPGVEITGNVCYRLGGGVSICGGADNRVHDNLFIECLWAAEVAPRGKDMFSSDGHGGFRVNPNRWNWTSLVKRLNRYRWDKPPYSTRYPNLKAIFQKDPIAAPWFNVVTRNVTVDCGRTVLTAGMAPEWSTIKDNWAMTDPGFIEKDRTKMDFRLRKDAPVYARGFHPIPFARIGLYQSPERRSWPVSVHWPAPDWKPRWMRLRELAAKSPTALPIFRVMHVTGKIVIDGKVEPMEWTPGDATGVNPDIHETVFIEWRPNRQKAAHPCQALLEVDTDNLYVGFRVPLAPGAGVSGGHVWGKDDAVEVALTRVTDRIRDVIVLRGYADGHWESSDEAGAKPEVVRRAAQGTAFAAAVRPRGGGWSAEWKIPFAALGIDPAVHNPKLLFNLSVRQQADRQWVMWKQTGGSTWDLTRAGFLWLAPFGDVAFAAPVAAHARIDLDSRRRPVQLAAGTGCQVASWAKPVGSYLSGETGSLAADHWQEMVFQFTPRATGTVALKLMGRAFKDPATGKFIPVWVYFDDVRVTGATLVNGGFETAAPKKGLPAGWRSETGAAYRIHDPKLAAAGEYCVKVWHNGRFVQDLGVVQGREVVVRARVRGGGVQGQ